MKEIRRDVVKQQENISVLTLVVITALGMPGAICSAERSEIARRLGDQRRSCRHRCKLVFLMYGRRKSRGSL